MTTLFLTQKAWRKIEQSVRKNPLVETGGVLMGFPVSDNGWVVTFASTPGPQSIQEPHTVTFDDQYLERLIKRKQLKTRGRLLYLGDWHSHTIKRLTPSRGDRTTVYEKTLQEKYTSPNPLMMIVGLGKQNQLQAKGYILANSLQTVKRIVLLENTEYQQLKEMYVSPYEAH